MPARTLHWTGASSVLQNTAANWVDDGTSLPATTTPVTGDTLIYPDPTLWTRAPSTEFSGTARVFAAITYHASSQPDTTAGVINMGTVASVSGAVTFISEADVSDPDTNNELTINNLHFVTGSSIAFDLNGHSNMNVGIDAMIVDVGVSMTTGAYINCGGMTMNGTLTKTAASAIGTETVIAGTGTINVNASGYVIHSADQGGGAGFSGTIAVNATGVDFVGADGAEVFCNTLTFANNSTYTGSAVTINKSGCSVTVGNSCTLTGVTIPAPPAGLPAGWPPRFHVHLDNGTDPYTQDMIWVAHVDATESHSGSFPDITGPGYLDPDDPVSPVGLVVGGRLVMVQNDGGDFAGEWYGSWEWTGSTFANPIYRHYTDAEMGYDFNGGPPELDGGTITANFSLFSAVTLGNSVTLTTCTMQRDFTAGDELWFKGDSEINGAVLTATGIVRASGLVLDGNGVIVCAGFYASTDSSYEIVIQSEIRSSGNIAIIPQGTNGGELMNVGGAVFHATAANLSLVVDPAVPGEYTNDGFNDFPSVGNTRVGDTTGNAAGTLALPSEANVKLAVQFGAGGTEFTGSYNGSDRWTSPSAGQLLLGVQLKNNSTSLNLTGTLDITADNPPPGGGSMGIGF